MTEEEARRWPDLMAIVEAKVKPERLTQKDKGAKEKWWQFIRPRPELHEAIRGLDRVLVIARVSQTGAFTFLPSGMVFNEKLVVFPWDRAAPFCLLQSRVHEVWARFFSTTLKDDLQYTPSDCFETFPFAEGWETNSSLEAAGRAYYDFRADLMVRNGEGLTGTYNRFHDPEEGDPDILKLRELHEAMDRAVLHAYGWTEIRPSCDFFLDYEEEGAEDDDTKPTKKKKPWRYRWPDQLRDEVLAHLLILNRQFAQRS
jgi:hypothetical protein